MTVTRPSMTAHLVGTPEVLLAHLPGCLASLDETAWPHVLGGLSVALPSLTILARLDPRVSPRVRIRRYLDGALARTFDLNIRERDVWVDDREVVLRLASDEALLEDYAPLADDNGAFAYQSSLRAVIGWGLGKVIPGAVLQAGGTDVPIRALIDSTNLVRNPRAANNLGDWTSGNSISRVTSGGPAGSATYVNAMSASAGQLLVNYHPDGVLIQAGKRYRISVSQNADAGTMIAHDGLVLDNGGNILLDVIETAAAATGGWDRRWVEFTAPANATRVQLRSFTTGSVAAGRSLNTTAWRVSEVTVDPTDTGFFDGTTTGTTEYSYLWDGTPHASSSRRIDLIGRADDLLLWPAGRSAAEFLQNLAQAAGYRLVCDEERKWTLRDENYTATGSSFTVRAGVNLRAGGLDSIARDSGIWFDAAVVRWKWTAPDGTAREAVESYALPSYKRLQEFERNAPYPGPGFAEYLVRRAQQRGREVTVSCGADWTARAEQPVEIVLGIAPVQLGEASRIEFDFDNDQMTVRARTIDTPAGAIDLMSGTINALAGTINAL